MQNPSFVGRLLLLISAASVSFAARGTVVLNLAPSTLQVLPGGTFNVSVSLTSTSEHTTGVDYFLRSPALGSGLFTITARTLGTSPYSDPTSTDAAVLAAASATLNKIRGTFTGSNGSDLGASATAEQGAGTFPVATFTIKVSPTALNGAYSIVTYNDPGVGYAGGASTNFASTDFNGQGSVSVNVVPEPASLTVIGLCAAACVRRRRSV